MSVNRTGIIQPLPIWIENILHKERKAQDVILINSRLLNKQVDHRLLGFQKMGNRKGTDQLRYLDWTIGTDLNHEFELCYINPPSGSDRTAAIARFPLSSRGSDSHVHTGAICSIMDSVFGACAFRNSSGGPTLALEFHFHSPLTFDASTHPNGPCASFHAQIESRATKKTVLSGSISSGHERLATVRGLWRNLGWGNDIARDESKNTSSNKLKSIFEALAAVPSACPMDDRLGTLGRRQHLPPTDWKQLAQQILPTADLELVTGQVLSRSGGESTVFDSGHLTRANGKLRLEYIWLKKQQLFISMVQFTGWCMGPPGMVHGGAILTTHVDACEAALLSPVAFRSLPPDIIPKVHHLECNYRSFTPLEQTYMFEVTLLNASGSTSEHTHQPLRKTKGTGYGSFAEGPRRPESGYELVRLRSRCYSCPEDQDEDEDTRVLHSDAIVTFLLPSRECMNINSGSVTRIRLTQPEYQSAL